MLDVKAHIIDNYTYNDRGQETGYYYMHVKLDGSYDTAYFHQTTYDNKGRPVQKIFPVANGKNIFQYTFFDSVAAEMDFSSGKAKPYVVYFYDKNMKIFKTNEYMWNIDIIPLYRILHYFYDEHGRKIKSFYFYHCDGYVYYSGPGSFCLNLVEYFKYDKEGRLVEHYKRERPENKND